MAIADVVKSDVIRYAVFLPIILITIGLFIYGYTRLVRKYVYRYCCSIKFDPSNACSYGFSIES